VKPPSNTAHVWEGTERDVSVGQDTGEMERERDGKRERERERDRERDGAYLGMPDDVIRHDRC